MTDLKEKSPYFYELVLINDIMFEYKINNNIRDEKVLNYIEKRLKRLNMEQKLNEELLLDTIAVILCLQPFYDGNSRTLKIYLRNYLNRFSKTIDINEKIIPVYYTSNDYISQNDIDDFKKKIN